MQRVETEPVRFQLSDGQSRGGIPHWTDAPLWHYLLKPYFSRLPRGKTSGQTETRDAILRCPAAYEKPTDDTDKSPTASPLQSFYTEYAPGSSTNPTGSR